MSTVDPQQLRDLSPDASGFGVSANGEAPVPTYYDRPLLKRPHWGVSVVAYLFMGGIMGGSSLLLALADEDEDAELARNARYLCFALASACPAVLVSHLGRPERFLHMLRIFKFKSVMSVGVWGLVAFSVPATASATAQAARDGILPAWLANIERLLPRRFLQPLQALVGTFIAGYTGVLISATAIPVWAKGKRYIPAMSVCSGIASACAANAILLAVFGGSARTLRRVERLEMVAGAAELVLIRAFERHAGDLGKPMYQGAIGNKLRTYTEILGIGVPLVLGLLPVHARWKTVVAGALTLVGGYVLRETLIESGKASADDPKAAFRQPE